MRPRMHKSRHHPGSFGFTLVEVMVASAIAAVASGAMITVFILASRYAGEGFTEARIVSRAAVSIEKISRDLTVAFRQNAAIAGNRPVVSDNNHTIAYSVPLAGGGTSRRRFRFDAANELLENEELVGGSWVNRTQRPFLEDVEDFSVFQENTEGFVSYVITVRVNMGNTGGVKRYSMVGRSLPRNI